ncbi:MAG TPA: 1,4-alpha-glucan branching protein domain-containing protein [Candidatus Limnocylindrales bacterium]|nr:1,4-alpha-glucan branching protein domain-containing protein [Candidatus Limnocylindrales bacterium]
MSAGGERDQLVIVLHGHLPYVRGAGTWPHGEEWLHEATLDSYLPLALALHDLRSSGVDYRLTIGLTPTLLEQLADPRLRDRSVAYAEERMRGAERDAAEYAELGATGRAALADRYRQSCADLLGALRDRFGGDLVAAFRDLERTGHLDLLGSAATHGYLPLLDAGSVDLQIAVGRASARRRLGLEPRGFWLPECAYSPGLERALERHGIGYVFVDAPLLEAPRGHRPAAAATSGALERPARSALERSLEPPAPAGPDALHPHRIGDSRVVALARDPALSARVWSAAHGYPGDAAYREFHRKDARSGLRYWRVTGRDVPLEAKALYEPGTADERALLHARDFVEAAEAALSAHRDATGSLGTLVVAFDLELFGHWWHEGVRWLAETLRLAAGSPRIRTASAPEALAAAGHAPPATLREGSWGYGNDHSTWRAPRTRWMWDELGSLADELARLRAHPPAGDLGRRALAQAARELLLAQSSDWPFLLTTDQAPDYARERFRSHAERCRRAIAIARRGEQGDRAELERMEAADDPFPDIAAVLGRTGGPTAG